MQSDNLNITVQQAIADFYNKNDFGDDGGTSDKYVWIKFGFFSIPIPNAESRRNNVYLHDLSHIITGCDTSWKGESAVSAWEVASGGWGDLYLPWLLTLWAMGLGVLFYPKNTFKAFKQGLSMNNALNCGLTRQDISQMPVSTLRQTVSNKTKPLKSPYLWMGFSFMIFIIPFIIGLMSVWIIYISLHA